MTHTVTITGYNSDGEGVSRLDDGRVVFIRGAARGDELEVELIQELSKIARATIVRVLTASPYRIEPDCPVYPECGGCDYRHIAYEEELYAKLSCVNDALRRIGGLSVQVSEILRTGQINGYRNKVTLHSGETSSGRSLGFYKARSRDVVPIEHCHLLKDDLNAAIKSLSMHKLMPESEVTLRSGRNGVSRSFGKDSSFSGNGEGSPLLEEELDGLEFRIEGFFQVNSEAAVVLFQKAREYAALTKDGTLLDLYCGVGALTLFVGRDAGFALGIEQNADAVSIARENALRNGFSHIDFVSADAADWSAETSDLTTDAAEPDCVIVDPPRKGLSTGAVSKILDLSPKRVVYISCNPATLARDLKALHGYGVRDICAVDMFPRTANIECCCLLERELR